MRILHVIGSLDPRCGGPPRACVEMCRELAKYGHRVAIYTTCSPGERSAAGQLRLQRPGALDIRYYPARRPRHYRFSPALAKALKSAVPEHDIVHIHSLYLFSSTLAAYYCRRYGVPYLVRPHGTLDPFHFRNHRGRKWVYERLIEWRNLNRAAAVHYTTVEEARLASRLGLNAPEVVVPLGVRPEQFALPVPRGEFARKHPDLLGKRIILFMGRLHYKKGLDLLAPAFAAVVRNRRDVRLVVVGPDDGYRIPFERRLAKRGVLHKVTFTGMLTGADRLAALRAADLFVLPSYTENFGLAVVEAMAAGLPVVISDKVNIWREVQEADAGLVTPCDAAAIAEALSNLLDHSDLRRQMAERGPRLVRLSFAWPEVARKMIEVYENIVAGRVSLRLAGERRWPASEAHATAAR